MYPQLLHLALASCLDDAEVLASGKADVERGDTGDIFYGCDTMSAAFECQFVA